MRLALPQSLNAQFTLAVLALAVLILAGGAMTIYTLSASAVTAQALAEERLTRLQDAQDLLPHALLIERKTLQIMNTGTLDSARRIFLEIVDHLKTFDELVDQLAEAAASDNIEVLDLRRSSQLLRNTTSIVAQVHESALKGEPAARQDGSTDEQVMQRLREELQGQADALVSAAHQQSTYFKRDYREAVQHLVDQSSRMRAWVMVLLVLSLLFTWLIARVFLGRHIVARLQEVSRYLRRTEDGPTPVTVPVGGADEIADMARAVEQFLDDRRQLKQTELQLRAAHDIAVAARRAQAAFLANMSHELRTPLNAILGYAQLLQYDNTLTKRQSAGLSTIEHSGVHLLSLINDLLDLSRIEAEKLDLFPGTVDLLAFMREITDTMSVKAQEKGLLLQVELTPDLPAAVRADEQRLRQVLLNLLSNAIKFTDTGSIQLRLQALYGNGIDSRLRFEVEDSGIGIAPDQLAKIFQPFEQVGNVNRRAGGTGLGLAISRQLIHKMGSEIYVDSRQAQAHGAHGSKFWFELVLPVGLSSATVQPARRQVTGYEGARKKVLVVDDVVENRALVMDLLGPLGFAVTEASNGREGLEKALAFQPDLILMDVVMPEMDGLEATRRLRQLPAFAAVPIIAISASASSTDQAQSLRMGADAFLAKPIDFDHLVQQIGRVLKVTWLYESAREPPVGRMRG